MTLHLIQVGVGSGGIAVLDLVARDERISRMTIVDPDVYQQANLVRHHFPVSAVGRAKVEAACDWLRERRPDLVVDSLIGDLLDPEHQSKYHERIEQCQLGICAVDGEAAKYHFDALMRHHGKPWTLGEVLAGGIGGFVHRFVPNGPCYGCVASFLQREVEVDARPAPDYAQARGGTAETTIPASKAAIAIIAGLHAQVTLDLIGGEVAEWTSLLFTIRIVPGIFAEAFRTHRFKIERNPACMMCRPTVEAPADLDEALDQALKRLES